MKHYYVYYSYEPWGRGYIGRRECSCLPEEDTNYFGSFYDKTFKPSEKIILGVFDTREKALAAEVELHFFYKVNKNPHFANLSRQTSIGFSGGSGFLGFSHSEESKEKISKNSASRRPDIREKMSKAHQGKTQTKETRLKKSLSLKGENNPMFGRTGENSPNYGRKHTQEVKDLLSQQKLGKPRDTESCKKQSETMKGKTGVNKGRHWITDGVSSKIFPTDRPIPVGWRKGRTL